MKISSNHTLQQKNREITLITNFSSKHNKITRHIINTVKTYGTKMKSGVILVLALVAATYPADSRPTHTEISRIKRNHLHGEPKTEKDVYKKILEIFHKHPYLCIGSFSMLCFWFSLCVLIPKQCLKRNGMCYFILCKCFCCKY